MRRPSTRSPFFFFNDTATTEIYTLSLHDALPILPPVGDAARVPRQAQREVQGAARDQLPRDLQPGSAPLPVPPARDLPLPPPRLDGRQRARPHRHARRTPAGVSARDAAA